MARINEPRDERENALAIKECNSHSESYKSECMAQGQKYHVIKMIIICLRFLYVENYVAKSEFTKIKNNSHELK